MTDDNFNHQTLGILNKLRDVVCSKGLVVDASKLKKNELLKLLGDE